MMAPFWLRFGSVWLPFGTMLVDIGTFSDPFPFLCSSTSLLSSRESAKSTFGDSTRTRVVLRRSPRVRIPTRHGGKQPGADFYDFGWFPNILIWLKLTSRRKVGLKSAEMRQTKRGRHIGGPGRKGDDIFASK